MANSAMADKESWAELVLPFPCLWNSQDPNFSNEIVKTVCRAQLLARCNQQASTPVDMESLKQWLASNVIVKTEPQPKLEDLVLEYPCLWNPKDSNYRNYNLRESSRQQLLEKFNSISTDQMTMSDVRRKLTLLHSRRKRLHPEEYKGPLPKRKKRPRAASTAQRVQSAEANGVTTAAKTSRSKTTLLQNSVQNNQSVPKKVCKNKAKKGQKKGKKKAKKGQKKGKNKAQVKKVACPNDGPGKAKNTDNCESLSYNLPTEPQIHCDSTAPLANHRLIEPPTQPTPPSTVISLNFNWCRLCGDLKNDCVDTTNITKPYLAKNKCELTVNDLSVELDFTNEALPKTICKDCDEKLLDMHDFVKRVQDTQATFKILELRKRKGEDAILTNNIKVDENVQQRKKFKVTIDFNKDTIPSLSIVNDCNGINNDEIDLISSSDSELEVTGQDEVRERSLSGTDAKANEEFEQSKCGVPVSIISQSPSVHGNRWVEVRPISATYSDIKDEVSEQFECEDSIDIRSHSPSVDDNNDTEINSGDEIDSKTPTDTFVKEVVEQMDESKVSVDISSCDNVYSVSDLEIKRTNTLDSLSANTVLANEVPDQTDLSSRLLPLNDDEDDETNRVESRFKHEIDSNLVTTEQSANEVSDEIKKRVVSVDINLHSSPSCNGDDENVGDKSHGEKGLRKLATYTDFLKVVVSQAANTADLSIENSGIINGIKCEDNVTIVDIKRDEDAIYIITGNTVSSKDAKCEDDETFVDVKKEIVDDIDDVR